MPTWPVRVIGLVLLVVRGLYRHVRNPMYLAVWAGILGQAVLLAQMSLLWWLLFVVVATTAFVKGYEEPTLRRQFPEEYDAYVAAVPGWLPRLRARSLRARG